MNRLSLVVLFIFAAQGTAIAQQQVDTTASPAPAEASSSPASQRPEVIGAEIDSQAYPAKFSEYNDKLDHIPIMALPLPLTEEQRGRIAKLVLQENAPVETINASPSEKLGDRVTVHDLPAELSAHIPAVDNLGYVRIPNKVLLVSTANKIVVGEISTQ